MFLFHAIFNSLLALFDWKFEAAVAAPFRAAPHAAVEIDASDLADRRLRFTLAHLHAFSV